MKWFVKSWGFRRPPDVDNVQALDGSGRAILAKTNNKCRVHYWMRATKSTTEPTNPFEWETKIRLCKPFQILSHFLPCGLTRFGEVRVHSQSTFTTQAYTIHQEQSPNRPIGTGRTPEIHASNNLNTPPQSIPGHIWHLFTAHTCAFPRLKSPDPSRTTIYSPRHFAPSTKTW